MGERKLATIRRIDDIQPIEGADRIVCCTVGGWKVVAQKGLYEIGDLACYLEIDSWCPHELVPELSKGKEPREFEGVKGERLRTIRLRGQISQGMLLPMTAINPRMDELKEHLTNAEGFDATELLGIKKWEKPIPACLSGQVRGNFPTSIPKTDQERAQNLVREIGEMQDTLWEITEKIEGSSMTCYLIDGEFGVCSRNLDLKETEGNTLWDVARSENIEEKMRELFGGNNVALQGELIGPGVQGNIYKLSKHGFRVFDIYDIDAGAYLLPEFRRALVDKMGLDHAPVLDSEFILNDSVDDLLNLAEGKSRLCDTEREGIVFKSLTSEFSFKAISNLYLLNGGE